MYYKVYLLLKNWESDDKSYYEDYITFLFGEYKKNKNLKNFEIFTLTAQHNLFAYAQNYLTWKIRKINKKLKNEEFDLSKTKKHFLLEKRNTYNIDFLNLHELQLQNKALIEISASMMRNIVLKKFEAGLYDGLSIFLEKYISKVAEKNRKAVTKYAYAHLYFAKKEYKKAIETLLEDNDDKTARMPNHFFKTDSYRLLIKSMFEIGVEEELEKYIARFRTYLTNNETKENKALFERHKRFLVYIKELLDASKRNDKMAFVELKAKIERRKDTVNSEWLIENIEMYLK